MTKPDGGNGNGGGMFGRVIVPPVQSEEKRTEGSAVSFRLPLQQAAALAAALTATLFLWIPAIRAMGPLVFWVAFLVVALTNLVRFIVVQGKRESGVTWLDILAAFLLAALTGAVGLACWKVSTYIFPAWSISKTWVNLLVMIPAVFALFLTVFLAPAFAQELLYRSPFLEKALGDIATGIALARWAVPPAAQKKDVVLRMVPANIGAIKARPEQVIDSEPEPADEAPMPRPQVAGYEYDPEYEVQMPSGAKRPLIDLIEYCQQAPIMGPGFEEWQTRRHWSHPRWGDVVDALSRVGVTTVRRPGVPVELLERDPDEAVRLLLVSLVEPPTPPADGSATVSAESVGNVMNGTVKP